MKTIFLFSIYLHFFNYSTSINEIYFHEFLTKIDQNNTEGFEPFVTVENTVTQYQDNYDAQNVNTFKQRFFMNGEYFQPGGPIILLLGGNNAIVPWRLFDTLPGELTRRHNGYLFYLEHRYYGNSIPLQNASVENLKYLNVDQALADIAHFIDYIKSPETIPGLQNSTVIVIGSAYAGSLAVWARQKFPHLIDGAWASSAPILLKSDHFEYKEHVGWVFRKFGNEECYNRLQDGFKEMENLIADGQVFRLSELFNLCDVLETPMDIGLFFSAISEFYSLLVKNENNEVLKIPHICKIITNKEITSSAEAVAKVWRTLLIDDCMHLTYNRVVQKASEIQLNSEFVLFGERQRLYQGCFQMGLFHTTTLINQPFGQKVPLDFFTQFCADIFGNQFNGNLLNLNIKQRNTFHGTLNLNLTDVIFTHGEMDPDRTVGVQFNLNSKSPAFIIKGASQSKDLEALTEFDSDSLIDVKHKILNIIGQWIRK